MKRILAYPGIILLLLVICCKPEHRLRGSKHFSPPVSFEEATCWADSILALMTIEEKINFIGGDRIFFTQAIPRLNIPSVMMADATQGVHLRDHYKNEYIYDQALPKTTAFPCPILLASTWNRELAGEYARAIGEECRAGGIAVLLGPGVNIYRQAQCGRNFEYFGEDPYLAGQMIENYVVGLQSTGTIATLKHFLTNNTDYYRRKSNSVVNERTLHEIYLPAFKSGIDAGAMAVMTSYNQLNGEWCGQSEYVINNLLRNQLGFKWLVMTDWWSVYDGIKVIKSGMDLEMPYRLATENALELLHSRKIMEENIDRMVRSILRTLYAMNAFQRVKEDAYLDKFKDHEEIALQTAREGIVLLRNEKNILPIEDTLKKILILGEYAAKIAQGGGAAEVEGYNHVTLADAMTVIFGENAVYMDHPSDNNIREADLVVLNIGTFDSEGWDRPFELPSETNNEISRVSELNPNTIVVVNSGSGICMTPWNNKVAAIIYAWYPGQNGAMAIAEIIAGKVNPSGKLPISIEREFINSPGYGYIPQGEELYNGWHNDEEKSHSVYDIQYKEEVFVGYRWYERQLIPTLYPFGFGLSYTSFEISKLRVSAYRFTRNDTLAITVLIKNTGDRRGAETVQLYVSDLRSSLARPVKELKGFEKVELYPGESKKVTLFLDALDFSFWDPESQEWEAEPGEFEISVGTSSALIYRRTTVVLL
jgi:beta-glucosidase